MDGATRRCMRLLVMATTLGKLVLALTILSACSDEDLSSSSPTREDCEALRDRMVDLRLESVTADRAQHEANLKEALGSSFVDRCVGKMARTEVRCGLDAANGEALLACGGQ